MSEHEESISLFSPSHKKKRKNNYRLLKNNPSNNKCIIMLLIFSIIQFIIIIFLLLRNRTNQIQENKYNIEDNNYDNENNINEKDNNIDNIKNNSEYNDKNQNNNNNIFILPPKEEKINEGKLDYKKEENNTEKKGIHIAMACDNKAIFPSLVSMTSALENNDKNKNILIYHLLLSSDFDMKKFDYFESLKKDYEFILNYVKIPPIFEYIRKKWKNTETVNYKLLLPLIYPDIPRMIFLDGDTLIFKDLSEMYDLNFNDNYILGFPFHTADSLDGWDKDEFKIYVNGGVLLFNIGEIRKNNMDFKLLLFHQENFRKTHFLEQDSLNYIFKDKIGLLPLKYGVYLFGNIEEYKKVYLPKMRIDMNLTELENAIENPSIVHLCCCNPKVWSKNTRQEKGFSHICHRFQKEFYFYANKTRYYDKIYNSYM